MARDPKAKPKGEESTVLFDSRGKRRDSATMIVKVNEVQPSEALFKFVAVRGPRQGKQFPLRGTELTVGRDEKNDVIIPDISVSRRHARLRRHADGWTVASLGPDSAVRVNGLKIEEHPLISGDLVEIGKAELQFVASDPASVRTRTDEQAQARELEVTKSRASTLPAMAAARAGLSPRIRKVAIACFAVVAVALALKGLFGHRSQGPSDGSMPALEKASPEELFAQARKEVLAQHWDAAEDLLTRAAKLDPDNPQLKHYQEVVAAEVINQAHVDTAEKAIAAKNLKAAAAELAAVPTDSLLSDQVATERGKLDQAVVQQIVVARSALAAGDLDGAGAAAAIALGGDPKSTAAATVKTEIDSKRTGVEVAADEQARSAAVRATEQRRQSGPIGSARSLFRSGDVKGALTVLAQAPPADTEVAMKLQDDIARCNQAFQAGKDAASAGEVRKAVESLGRSRSMADSIAPGSTIAAEAGHQLAQLEDKLGFAARASGKLDEAYHHFAIARGADARDDQAQSEIKRLEGEAHEIFIVAYSLRNQDTEAAERKFRQVMGMTAASADDHRKAQEWISKLGSGGK